MDEEKMEEAATIAVLAIGKGGDDDVDDILAELDEFDKVCGLVSGVVALRMFHPSTASGIALRNFRPFSHCCLLWHCCFSPLMIRSFCHSMRVCSF